MLLVEMPLSLQIVATFVPLRAAMRPRVSPLRTVYVLLPLREAPVDDAGAGLLGYLAR